MKTRSLKPADLLRESKASLAREVIEIRTTLARALIRTDEVECELARARTSLTDAKKRLADANDRATRYKRDLGELFIDVENFKHRVTAFRVID